MYHDPKVYPRLCVYVDVELVLIANECNLVRIKDEELDGVEDGGDAHQKGEHLLRGRSGDLGSWQLFK